MSAKTSFFVFPEDRVIFTFLSKPFSGPINFFHDIGKYSSNTSIGNDELNRSIITLVPTGLLLKSFFEAESCFLVTISNFTAVPLPSIFS